MSKHETPMTRWYWRDVNKRKGLLIREFPAVEGGKGRSAGKRHIDGVIVCGRKSGDRKGKPDDRAMVKGKTVVVIQSKAKRLGMYLIGQTIVSRELMKSLGAKVKLSIALHRKDDPVMEKVLLRFKKCQAVKYTPGRTTARARN